MWSSFAFTFNRERFFIDLMSNSEAKIEQPNDPTTLWRCVIRGRVPVKKNSKRVFGGGKNKRVLYSKPYLLWQASAIEQIRSAQFQNPSLRPTKPLNFPLRAEFIFYYDSHQWEVDASNAVEGPQDLLQTLGVIENDKLIYDLRVKKIFLDKKKAVDQCSVVISLWALS